MRIIGRLILILIALVLGLALVAYAARGPIAGVALRHALKNAGFETAALKVRDASLTRAIVSDLALGRRGSDPDITVETITVTYDWRRLLQTRQVRRLEIGPSVVRLALSDHGDLSAAGRKLTRDGDSSAGSFQMPAELISMEGVKLFLSNTAGEEIAATIDGAFDQSTGAAFDMTLASKRFRHREVTLAELKGEAGLRLLETGRILLTSSITGDVSTEQGGVSDLDITVDGDGQSWRAVLEDKAVLDGLLTIDIRSSDIVVDQAPALSSLLQEEAKRLSTEQVRVLSAVGGLALQLEGGALILTAPEGAALILTSNRGDRLTLTSIDGQPFYQEGGASALGVAANLTGPGINGSMTLQASQQPDDAWRFSLQGALIDPVLDTIDMGATSLDASGLMTGDRLTSSVEVATTIKRADVGRLAISDAPFRASLEADLLLDDQKLSVNTGGDACVSLEKGAFSLAGQDITASIQKAALCQGDAPLLRASWGDAPQAQLQGRLQAVRGAYRLGETTMNGAPPWIDFAALYDPAAHKTVIDGRFGNGAVTVNDALVGTNVSGAFTAMLLGDELSAEAVVDEVTITQAAETKQLATLLGAGTARLADDIVRFDYQVKTQTGVAIGAGDGRHAVLTGEGSAVFASPDLNFTPSGLQPTDIASVLTGNITNTTGSAVIEARAQWTGDDGPLQTSAVMQLKDITFQGPGITVSQTRGLSGEIALSNLTPPTTDGPQTIKLGGVDLSALILEDGEVTFELPGDETLHVLKAEFPWFGGAIGAYDTEASIAGDKAITRLQASNVDLSQMLDFLDIEGLSGEGVVEGVLPLVVEEGLASIEGGVLTAVGPGVVRYTGPVTEAAGGANDEANIAFDLLRNLQFNKLRAEIDGPLDGDIQFKLLFEGTNEVNLNDPRITEPVTSPVIYRISLEAPLLTLINNARNSADPDYLIRRARDFQIEEAPESNEAPPQ